eukprot:CAMPEP_0180357308 /NCGR_PEP_ID=MMETSP0989-20121125/9843_1 /TAXON_ID=697907 /ORGANISM="non described non described, Strain CCMP2293" /LENGTH=35 /DNA_ID= /DNA_START= /DNA_END= /DNA_ORIENTATION=
MADGERVDAAGEKYNDGEGEGDPGYGAAGHFLGVS